MDETPKGWYIQWIDRDPENLARQKRIEKMDAAQRSEEERQGACGAGVALQAAKFFLRCGEAHVFSFSISSPSWTAELIQEQIERDRQAALERGEILEVSCKSINLGIHEKSPHKTVL